MGFGAAGLVGGDPLERPKQREYPSGHSMTKQQLVRDSGHVTTNWEVKNPIQRTYPNNQALGASNVSLTVSRARNLSYGARS